MRGDHVHRCRFWAQKLNIRLDGIEVTAEGGLDPHCPVLDLSAAPTPVERRLAVTA